MTCLIFSYPVKYQKYISCFALFSLKIDNLKKVLTTEKKKSVQKIIEKCIIDLSISIVAKKYTTAIRRTKKEIKYFYNATYNYDNILLLGIAHVIELIE